MGERPAGPPATAADPAERLTRVLAHLGTNVHQISGDTATLAGTHGRRYLVPHNFCARLRHGSPPGLFQLAALSIVTGRRLVDWARVFDLDLESIPWLQLMLHTERTIAVSPQVGGRDVVHAALGGLGLGDRTPRRRTGPLVIADRDLQADAARTTHPRLYARIGRRDCLPAAETVAGTLLRIDPARTALPLPRTPSPLYLVQHPGGLSICQIEPLDATRVVLLSGAPACQLLALDLPRQALILGTVESWLRPLTTGGRARPRVLRDAERRRSIVPPPLPARHVGHFLRDSRQRVGLSLRDVHLVTRRLSRHCDNDEYRIALGTLVRAERERTPPRRMSTLIALAVAYAVDVTDLLAASGIDVGTLGSDPLPGD